MTSEESKEFKKYLSNRKKLESEDGQARAIAHPINYGHFKLHQREQYALKHRKQILDGPKATPKQGWQMMHSLMQNWTTPQLFIFAIFVVFIVLTLFTSIIPIL